MTAEIEQKNSATNQKAILLLTIAFSLAIYAIMIGLTFDADVEAKIQQAFGAELGGLTIVWVVRIVQTLLYLPMPWVFWHAMRISFQAYDDGNRAGLIYFFTVGEYHPHLRKSQLICLAGLLYFCLIVGTWIVYADSRKI